MAVSELDALGSTFDSATLTYSVSAGSDRVLVVANIQQHDVQASLTADYGGQSMTQTVEIFQEGGGFDIQITVWELDEAGIAAASDTTVTISGDELDTGSNHVVARSWQDVDQTTPIPETNTDSTASDVSPLTGADIVAGDGTAVMSFAVGNGATAASWGSDLTERLDSGASGGGERASVADEVFATGQTVECRCTFTNLNNRAAQASIEIAPSVSTLIPPGLGPTLSEQERISSMASVMSRF